MLLTFTLPKKMTKLENHKISDALDTRHLGVAFPFATQYDNFIGGLWVPPKSGQYFENTSPITGEVFCRVARSNDEDVDLAVNAALKAQENWAKMPVTERSYLLLQIAQIIEDNILTLAVAETIDNGKPIRESINVDLPLIIDHFRYFAGVIRADESSIAQIDPETYAYHYYEPLGVIAQIIPWNFPLLMAAWKLAPALAAGNTVVLKPAEQTPASIGVLIDLIGDVLPKGVLNVVQGFGLEAGKPLATHPKIAKIAFTGETTTGRLIMQYASQNLIPVTLELGGKSPNIFFSDVMREDDNYFDKALEGFAMFAMNQGEVCAAPTRALVQQDIYDKFMERTLERVRQIKHGNPLWLGTMIGAQASIEQMEKIKSYITLGQDENAKLLIGGHELKIDGCENGNYIAPTIFEGHNEMRIFQEEIFGPVLCVTPFKTFTEAMNIANDSAYGLAAGIWSRDQNTCFNAGRALQVGRVWVNCYGLYPAHAAFGGYKQSGIGRETHKMVLNHYRHTKNVLISYDEKTLGLF